MNIEWELKQAFKRASLGDVNVKIEKIGMKSGYQIETEMGLLIKITRANPMKLLEDLRLRPQIEKIPPKSYDIIRNGTSTR